MREFVLHYPLRTLVKIAETSVLKESGVILPKGFNFSTGGAELCIYNGERLPALPLTLDGITYYVLEREFDHKYWIHAGTELLQRPVFAL